MFKYFWKHFPIFYVLPFLMATTRIDLVAQLGDKLRWIILIVGCCMAMQFGFRRSFGKAVKLYLADIIILSFISLFLLSALWSIAPSYTVQRAISLLLLYICSFWLLWRYANQFSEDTLIRYLLYTIAAFLAVNIVVGTLLFPHELLSLRFQGLFNNPNNIGIISCLALPLAAARWLHNRKRIDLAGTVVVSLNLLAAGSRAALLGVAMAMAIITISLFVRRPSRAIFIGIVGLTAIGLLIQTTYFEEHILREDTLATASNRTVIWEIAKRYIENRPDMGHGFGTDAIIHEHYGVSLKRMGLRGYGASSSYYGLAIQMGWPVTYVFFGLIIGFTVICMVRYWRDYPLITLIAAITSGLIVNIFEPVMYSAGNAFSFLFWVCFMLALRRIRYRRPYSPLGRPRAMPAQPNRVKTLISQ